MKIKILLVDDHRVLREGLRSLLQIQEGHEIAGEAEDGRAAVQMAVRLRPHVVLMDVGMPDLNGIEATRQIKAQAPEVKVIALSMHSDKRFVAGMFQAGASGYLLKTSAFEEVATAIKAVVADGYYASPKIAESVVGEYARHMTRLASSPAELSHREREVLQLLAEGYGTREIAERLNVSTTTIDTHRSHIMEKLEVDNLAGLVKYAIREGLTSVEA